MRSCIQWIVLLMSPVVSVRGAEQLEQRVDQYDLALRVNRVAEQYADYAKEAPAAKGSIKVNPARVTANLSPFFIGYNIEDLNYAFFPGLYAQMLYGESFEDQPDVALPEGWRAELSPKSHETPKDPDLLRKWRGGWSFENGIATLIGDRVRRIFADKVSLTNGTIDVEVLQPSHDRSAWGPGILACWKPGSYYYLYLAPERDAVVLGKGTDPKSVFSAKTLAWKTIDLSYDTWHKLRFTINNGQISVYVDGQLVLTHNDPEPLSGSIGLVADSATNLFRNLTVTTGPDAVWTADFSLSDRPYNHKDHISRWWDPIVGNNAQARFRWENASPVNTDRSQMIELVSGSGPVGIYNTGLQNWGLTFKEGRDYQGRLYLRGDYKGEVTLALQSRDGTKTYATQKIKGVEKKEWKRFDISLVSKETDRDARFAILIDQPGKLFVDQVILMPGQWGLYKGLPLRKDLAEKLVAGISHIRFGGDMIDSHSFDWKKMIASQDQRRQYRDGWNHHKSAQFMIFEFLEFCEAAGITPIPNFSPEVTPDDLAEFVEYCNGDEQTAWGRKRRESGRTKPYGIQYLMYGNGLPRPEWTAEALDKIKKVDPKVKVIIGDIGHTPWWLISERAPDLAKKVNAFADRLEAMGTRPEVTVLGSHLLWEEFILKARKDFPALAKNTKLYAEEVNGHTHDWQRGLNDALFAITSEKYGDTIFGHGYCTALQASGHLHSWNEGHIFFDSAESWYQPPGWVVKMLGENILPRVVESEVEGPRLPVHKKTSDRETVVVDTPALNVSASVNDQGDTLILKVVNLYGGPVDTRIELVNGGKLGSLKATSISSLHLRGTNTSTNQMSIAPVVEDVKNPEASYTFKPMSFTVLKYALGPQM